MKHIKKYFSILVLLSSFCIKSMEAFLTGLAETACLGTVTAVAEIMTYDVLFRFISPEEYKRIMPPFKLEDFAIPTILGTLGSLPVGIAGNLGSWPRSEITDLFIPAALGALTTSTLLGLKIKKLKGRLVEQWPEFLKFSDDVNFSFIAGLCGYTMYNRYTKIPS